jgi:hypothetical protein
MNSVGGTPVRSETGTTTGEFQVVGTITNVGATTVETEMIAEVGTGTTTEYGNELGTFSHEMTTTLGDEAMVTTTDDGRLQATEAGTKTGDEKAVGTTTVTDGTVTCDKTDVGTVIRTDDGTFDGTLVKATIAIDGDEMR